MKIESIKFKAKRLSGKGWVEGNLIRSTTGIKERAYVVNNFSSMSNYSIIGVEPSTVCQFTGLKDCEDKEVWKGDIVEFETYDLYKGKVKIEAVIEYINSVYFAVTDNIPYSLCTKCIKVVGNKLDNDK